MRGVRLAGCPALRARIGTDELPGTDRIPHRRMDSACDGHQPAMPGTPPRDGPTVWFGLVELPRQSLGLQASLAHGEAPVPRSDLPIEVPEWLLELAPTAGLDGRCCRKRQVSLAVGRAPGLPSRPEARLAIDRTAAGHSSVSVERAEGFYLATGRTALGLGRSTIRNNQPLYNGLVCMHLGVCAADRVQNALAVSPLGLEPRTG